MKIITLCGTRLELIRLSEIYENNNKGYNNSGVYCILSLNNSKVYVGSSKNIYVRMRDHLYRLKNNRHYNVCLQRAFLKYKEHNFYFAKIEGCSILDLVDREQHYIQKFNCLDRNIGYNIAPTANNTVFAEETKRKISASMTGKPGHRLGFKASDATKDKLRLISTGKITSEQTKKKISKALKGINTWAKGSIKGPRSLATKKKISVRNRGSNNGMAKPVVYIKDNVIEGSWQSAYDAANVYNIKAYTLRRYIITNKIYNGGYFKYEDNYISGN